ncbi:MAG: hypothetical protein EZS28_016949 [Streblomastix strix]|uniref:Uncharacterized protein n=1 Tax=Streblomastix strix TaxID=222440 RepID=A0A5J4VY55_9EUKA|nr:MAG: hypothetical protein EZS28_016949 [Streblomastix strix]
MMRRTNQTCKRPPSRDSCQTLNYANLVPQNLLHSATQLQPTFVNAFRQNVDMDLLDPDQTIATPEKQPSNAIAAARALQVKLSGQEMQQISFIAEDLPQEQVVEARQRARLATVLLKLRRPSKRNHAPGQPLLTFDQVLADLQMKLLQHYRQLQRTLTQIAK